MLSATRVHWAELLYIQQTRTHTHFIPIGKKFAFCMSPWCAGLHLPCAPSDLALIRADLPAALILFSCQLFTAHDRFYILRVQCFVL